MELNISELDNMNPYDTFDYKNLDNKTENYWEKPLKQETKEKRKKVSFNDILSNMNLVVNKQGVLQLMVPNNEELFHQNGYQTQTNTTQTNTTQINKSYPNSFSQQNYYQSDNLNVNKNVNKNVTRREEPIDKSLKHSYIYNKYFKDYVDPNIQKSGPRVAKTIEEYNKMLLDDKIKAIEEKKRIQQIKSTKLMFTVAPGSQSNPRNIVASKNNLRMMNFG